MNEKRIAIAVVVVVVAIAVITAGFLLVTANEKPCEICGMSNCNMDHSGDVKCVKDTVEGEKCIVCGEENCKMDHGNATNGST